MVQYRKNKHGREFFRINGSDVTRVINKELSSTTTVDGTGLFMGMATDPYLTTEITEEEFTSAYKEALDRIALMKIV